MLGYCVNIMSEDCIEAEFCCDHQVILGSYWSDLSTLCCYWSDIPALGYYWSDQSALGWYWTDLVSVLALLDVLRSVVVLDLLGLGGVGLDVGFNLELEPHVEIQEHEADTEKILSKNFSKSI